MLKKNLDEAMKCVDRLDKSVGGDPYLNYVRASFAFDRGDRTEARRLAKRVVEEEPTFKESYYFLIGLSLEDQKHDETLEWLKKVREKLSLTFENLTTVKEYEHFVKSPQYQEWLKYLAEEAKRTKVKQRVSPKVKQKAKQDSRPPGSASK